MVAGGMQRKMIASRDQRERVRGEDDTLRHGVGVGGRHGHLGVYLCGYMGRKLEEIFLSLFWTSDDV